MTGTVRWLRRFARGQDGSATIEALLWIPFFFAILLLGVQVALIATAQSQVLRIVQDGNRAFALGRLDGSLTVAAGQRVAAPATQEAIEAAVDDISPNATVESLVDSNKVIVTTVTMPASDLSPFSILPDSLSMDITVTAQQIKEF